MKIIVTALLVVLTVGTGRVSGQERQGSLWFTAIENGDTNGDWKRDLGDAVYLLSYLYRGGPAPAPVVGGLCPAEIERGLNGDSSGDGRLDVSDAIAFLGWIFHGGAEPAPFTCAGGFLPDGGGSGGAVGGTNRPIGWTIQGSLGAVGMRDGLLVFSGNVGGLHVIHLGLASIEFEVLAAPTSPTTARVVSGNFTLTAANGDLLHGNYHGGGADFAQGIYSLESDFTGGTGRFTEATGSVHTDGLINIAAGTFAARVFGRISY
jgi:hypothetical protein